ncbi:MAG: DUF2231 domain-containing protein [Pseudomonadota bacterium]
MYPLGRCSGASVRSRLYHLQLLGFQRQDNGIGWLSLDNNQGSHIIEKIYQAFAAIGYSHPLHPTVIHLPIGLILGATLFGVIAVVFRRTSFATTAKHCMALAFLALFPAVFLGYGDWRHFYGGAFLFAIKMKLFLAGLLTLVLLLLLLRSRKADDIPLNQLPLYFLCAIIIVGIGYFGGELVYGKKAVAGVAGNRIPGFDMKSVRKGEVLFSQRCAFCHSIDSTDTVVGPGLKGLFSAEQFSVSQLPATPESVRQLLKKPFKDMPSFDQLTSEEIDAILVYLQNS